MPQIDTLKPTRSQGHFDKSVYLAAFRACSAASPHRRTGTCSQGAPHGCQATPGTVMALDAAVTHTGQALPAQTPIA